MVVYPELSKSTRKIRHRFKMSHSVNSYWSLFTSIIGGRLHRPWPQGTYNIHSFSSQISTERHFVPSTLLDARKQNALMDLVLKNRKSQIWKSLESPIKIQLSEPLFKTTVSKISQGTRNLFF